MIYILYYKKEMQELIVKQAVSSKMNSAKKMFKVDT